MRDSVDAIPYDVGELIINHLDYRPRPVPPSYSSYTPALQRADARHFADPRTAPDTVVFGMGFDVDRRLPTLATGPSPPILARWYELAGVYRQFGLVRRRRIAPRGMRRTALSLRPFAIGEWTPLPPATARQMTTAAIRLDRRLLGRALNLLSGEPELFVEVRRFDGSLERTRFVPGMAEVETAASPPMLKPDILFSDTLGTICTLFPGTHPIAAPPVEALRLVGSPTAAAAFGRGTIRFALLDFGR